MQVIAEDTKMLFDGLIDPLGLSIARRMEGCRQVWFGPKHTKEMFPPSGSESRSSIGNNVGGDAMYTEDVVGKLSRKHSRIVGCFGSNEVSLFSQSVGDYKDSVVAG